jgi:hypothetical protein
MRIIIEEVEGAHYQDVILTPNEVKDLGEGKLIEGLAIIRSKRYYIGIRLGYKWRHEDESSSAFLQQQAE